MYKPAQIIDEIEKLIGHYEERDPLTLAEAMDILVSCEPMGYGDNCCKGFFVSYYGIRHITVNSDLPDVLRQVILAHELGHAVLHRHAGDPSFVDIAIFDSVDPKEYEANLFAAELILDDNDVISTLKETNNFFQTASVLGVPSELLDFKFKLLRHKGFAFNSPVTVSGDFLRRVSYANIV